MLERRDRRLSRKRLRRNIPEAYVKDVAKRRTEAKRARVKPSVS